MKLSVALATFNEEENIEECLKSVKKIADEVVVVDGSSTDKTVQIAKKLGAKVTVKDNPRIFHINKQKAIDQSTGDWILLLDADERVTPSLAEEIQKIMKMSESQLSSYQQGLVNRRLFLRHQRLVEERDGSIGSNEGEYVAFYCPRLNYFLGKYLQYGGVYPDGVIRLFKKGGAYLPCKDVHEQMVVKGRVGWLQNNLFHYDSPTFDRYLERNNRYINHLVEDLKAQKMEKNVSNFIEYMVVKPVWWFLWTTLRHKGILDGWQGIVFSFYSALRFPRAYSRYITRR